MEVTRLRWVGKFISLSRRRVLATTLPGTFVERSLFDSNFLHQIAELRVVEYELGGGGK